jgi:phosphinothricin acetyltransferase
MKVRLATELDIPSIVRISNWAAEHTPANFALKPETEAYWVDMWSRHHERYPWLVADDPDAGVIGFAKASAWNRREAYDWTAETAVYIDPQHHGRGIGKALYTALMDMLRAQGFRRALARITLPNAASERLHASVGFEMRGASRQIGWKFGRWHDVSFWDAVLSNETPGEILPVSAVCVE